jgi:Tol biopolymer transport system component
MTGVTGAGQYALSANGTLLYLPESTTRLLRRIVRISQEGVEEPLLFEPRAFQNIAASPDGRRVAVTIYERGASDLWVGDIERGILQRLTSEGGSVNPVWSTDGQRVYFAMTRAGARIYQVPIDGSGPPSLVSSVASLVPESAARDGVLFACRLGAGGVADILTVAPDGTTRDWLATAANESGPRVSPDNRYVVYQSTRAGRPEVYVRAVSGEGPEQQVSVAGGANPGWSSDSRAILYVGPNRSVHRAEWHDGSAGRPRQIYANPGLVVSRAGGTGLFGLMAIDEERPLTTLNLVIGWSREASKAR